MENNTKDKNYYEVLEIPTDASPEEVHNGYLRAKNAYSHDSLALYSLMSKDECVNVLEMIEEAYSILSETSKRNAYDEARGIIKTYSSGHPRQSRGDTDLPPKKDKTDSPPTGHLTKLVASTKFALDFSVKQDFETKIEQTTEYTGEFLKEVREYKNVDIARMSDMTKVSKTYLANIESEQWDKLPALVYVRGFVYQYAKCLKLNPDLVATSYLHRLKKLKGVS